MRAARLQITLALLGSLSFAGSAAEDAVPSPPVAGLFWDNQLWNEKATIYWTAIAPQPGPPHPTYWEWTFSGCSGEVSPTTSSDPGPVVVANHSGVMHASVDIHIWD
jgi:hypothetical protein